MRSASRPRNNDHVETFIVPARGTFPNNGQLPVVLYRTAFDPATDGLAGAMERRFHDHGWGGGWRNGIYPFDHYHSTTHEVLGIATGHVTVQLGGPGGHEVTMQTGDVVVLPAGVAHRNLGASDDLLVIGAYPDGRPWDMNRGDPGERPQTDDRIAHVPLPVSDPIAGQTGPLTEAWADAS